MWLLNTCFIIGTKASHSDILKYAQEDLPGPYRQNLSRKQNKPGANNYLGCKTRLINCASDSTDTQCKIHQK